MRDLGWQTPYRLKSSGSWPFRRHVAMFEDTEVAIAISNYEVAADVVAALNGAYNLGRSSMALEAEFEARRTA